MSCVELWNINSVFGSSIVSNCLAKFRIGNFDFINNPRCRPESKVDNDVLKVTVKFDPCKLGISKQTISIHLVQIRKEKKIDNERKTETKARSSSHSFAFWTTS
uniref:Uncharacterized protein n=1 Tax=Glossina palpalis gambiensis TaxID=67801 RepID=A0A1B0B970_9MUSC